MAMCMLQSGESEQLVDMARCLSSPNLMLKASRVPGVLPLFSPREGQRSRVLVLAKDNNNICSNGPNSRCTSQEVRRRADERQLYFCLRWLHTWATSGMYCSLWKRIFSRQLIFPENTLTDPSRDVPLT